jgi:DNA-binding CsgD family transcriptional regulator
MVTKTRSAKTKKHAKTDKQDIPTIIDMETDKEDTERHTKYITHVRPRLGEVYQWLKDGMTEYSIAEQLGICQDTWTAYKKRYSEISDLYTRAQDERNALVLDAMYRKSTGIKVSTRKQRPGKDGTVVDLVEEVYIPPDHNAADLYLRNRMPGYVSTRPELGSGNTFIAANVNVNQIKGELQELLAEIKKLESPAAVEVEAVLED